MAHEDPIVGFHFEVEIQGAVQGYFTECSGLGSETETIEHKVMENKQEVVMKIPGRLKWEDITLKRGITKTMDVWDWRKKVEEGKVEASRQNGSITMYDQERNPVAQWDFLRAWPSKVSGPQPKADSNEIAIEEMTLVHEGIKRVTV